MRFPIKTTIALVLLVAAGVAGYLFVPGYLKQLNRTKYRYQEVTKGSILQVVNSTGKIQPIRSVAVGAFVSGPIQELYVDFNDWVEKGQVLAKIDPRIYEAAVARDKATLETKKADLKRVEALEKQAYNDKMRSIGLRKLGEDFISDSEMDQFKYSHLALVAQKVVAKSFVDQAQANLENSEANLKYTEIVAPEPGLIIDRKIDAGQTVAASFQTPELFVIAPRMNETMHIFAEVDEADIGLIREAQSRNLPIHFTVDAYPKTLFNGKIADEGIRMKGSSTQNVVTYQVIVESKNSLSELQKNRSSQIAQMNVQTIGLLSPSAGRGFLFADAAYAHNRAKHEAARLLNHLRLLPEMTASISFEINEAKNKLRIPNAALRYFPERRLVFPEDRKLLDGSLYEEQQDTTTQEEKLTAIQTAEKQRNRNRRHVWVEDGDFLKAVEVITGLSDNQFTELVSGDLAEGQKLVTGIKKSR